MIFRDRDTDVIAGRGSWSAGPKTEGSEWNIEWASFFYGRWERFIFSEPIHRAMVLEVNDPDQAVLTKELYL
jgi:hypothetical protein